MILGQRCLYNPQHIIAAKYKYAIVDLYIFSILEKKGVTYVTSLSVIFDFLRKKNNSICQGR